MNKLKAMVSRCHLILLCGLLAFSGSISGKNNVCPVTKIEAKRLADLHVPRSGHSALVVNGEVTLIGGHTSGFVLTPTAEYLKDGKWHLLQMIYAHDGGFSIALRAKDPAKPGGIGQSGKVLIGGGFKDNLGISQSFEVEMYDASTHTFNAFGCLDQKRALATAVELADGQVLITGNWYADDGMELYDGKFTFSHVKSVSQSRTQPHVFRTSDGDVLILSGYDTKGRPIGGGSEATGEAGKGAVCVERLKGDSFSPALFDNWSLLPYDVLLHSDDSFIGDEEKGSYAYLVPVQNKDGKMAIAEVRDTVFSLLPTATPIPTASRWGNIVYYSPVYADRQRHRGYVVGGDNTGRLYALCIDYAKKPASLTLCYTDPLTDTLAFTTPVLTAEGNLMLTGFKSHKRNLNFAPSAQVWLLCLGDDSLTSLLFLPGIWPWGVLAVIALAVVLLLFVRQKMKSRKSSAEAPEAESALPIPSKNDVLLMQRISHLMDEEQIYLRPGLKVSDIAAALSTNSRYVSECVKAARGYSLIQFLNEYRVEHAKRLLAQHPDMKISTIAVESGFTNDKALTRYFKELTGMTPTEWKNSPQKR